MLINLRSLNNKVYNLTQLLEDRSVDVCCATETWLKGDNEPAIANFKGEGFDVISYPRVNKK